MDWIDHFRENGARRIEIDWTVGITVPDRVRGPLVRSLQRFQVGESGEGRHLRRHAAATGDVIYAEAIRLFLAEERVHASYLRRMLDALGATTISAHWTDLLFITGRRLLGLRLELLTLLAAEMVALYYYRMLRSHIDDPLIDRVCAQILRDEAGHVAFHTAYFADEMSRRSRPVRWLYRMTLRAVHTCAEFVVALDHRDLIVALGVRPAEFLRECEAIYDRVDRRVFEPRRNVEVASPACTHAPQPKELVS
jgi:hypothetical protein